MLVFVLLLFIILLLFFLFCCCFFLWWHYTCILSVKDKILNKSFEMELLRGNFIVVNQLASTIVSQLFQCIHVLFFRFLVFVVFFWCLILLILKSLQELLLPMSFSQFYFFPVWMHIFMLSFFPFSSDFYLHLTASQGFPLWFDILHWWYARYSTQLLLWIQAQTWSCLGW